MGGGTGRFSSRVYMRIFLPGTISPGTICKLSIISSRQRGDGSRLSELGSRFTVTGGKTSRQNHFHIKGTGQIRDIYMHGEIPFNFPSRLPNKQSLTWVGITSLCSKSFTRYRILSNDAYRFPTHTSDSTRCCGIPLMPAKNLRCSNEVRLSNKMFCWGQMPKIENEKK